MKKDIANRGDIEILINQFYDKVKLDNLIGHFFTDIVKVNWEKHLPVMYDFWENIVFHKGIYDGNPMEKHQQIHARSPLNTAHFTRWNELFNQTADDLFEGERTENIKQRAKSIATIMQIRLFS